jgi:hypothetical protein
MKSLRVLFAALAVVFLAACEPSPPPPRILTVAQYEDAQIGETLPQVEAVIGVKLTPNGAVGSPPGKAVRYYVYTGVSGSCTQVSNWKFANFDDAPLSPVEGFITLREKSLTYSGDCSSVVK